MDGEAIGVEGVSFGDAVRGVGDAVFAGGVEGASLDAKNNINGIDVSFDGDAVLYVKAGKIT